MKLHPIMVAGIFNTKIFEKMPEFRDPALESIKTIIAPIADYHFKNAFDDKAKDEVLNKFQYILQIHFLKWYLSFQAPVLAKAAPTLDLLQSNETIIATVTKLQQEEIIIRDGEKQIREMYQIFCMLAVSLNWKYNDKSKPLLMPQNVNASQPEPSLESNLPKLPEKMLNSMVNYWKKSKLIEAPSLNKYFGKWHRQPMGGQTRYLNPEAAELTSLHAQIRAALTNPAIQTYRATDESFAELNFGSAVIA